MVQKSNMMQRFFDIWAGFICALAIVSIWDLINHKHNPFSDFYGCWTILSFIIGFALMRRRKIRQRPAGKILGEDKRLPVIYLRSFKDDKITSRPIWQSSWPALFTEEEYLVDVLHDFGPCIAIGQPAEQLPDLGAARMYVDNDKWHDKVRELLISSKLIVLRAGKTQNFLWEVEQSIKNVNPKNIIILIPKINNIYHQFHALVNQYFPKSLPNDLGNANLFSGIASLHGYLYFDEDWTPYFVPFQVQLSFWHRNVIDLPTYVIRNSLVPIYERFGLPVPASVGSNLGILLVTFLISLLGLFILNQ